jgi:ubiquinone/menaquinone biosynthesis C-methylase UbiE
VCDLGTATGEVINTIHKVNSSLKLEFIGIDISEQMLKRRKKKCTGIENVTFYNDYIEHFNFKPLDLIISAFTLQFIEPGKRR